MATSGNSTGLNLFVDGSIATRTSVPAQIAAALTVPSSLTNTTYFVSSAAAYAITMPAPTTAGLQYKFIVSTGGANTITIDCGAGLLATSSVASRDGTAVTVNGGTQNALITNGHVTIGDSYTFTSNGTKWFCTGICGDAAGFTTS